MLAAVPKLPDAHPVAVETALMAVGLPAILRGEPRYGVLQRDEASRIPKQIKALVRKFLANPKREPLADLPPFDYTEVATLINNSGTQEQIEALHSAFPDRDLGEQVRLAATRILAVIKPTLPKRTVQTATGTVAVPPTDIESARIARAWSVACDPRIVLRDLCEQSLSPDMVKSMRAFYPGLYDVAKEAVAANLTAIKAKRPKWELEGTRGRLLRMLLGLPPLSLGLAADLQRLYSQAPAPNAAGAKPAAGANIGKLDLKGNLQTPGQDETAPGAPQPK
jgi:hypothetical protein